MSLGEQPVRPVPEFEHGCQVGDGVAVPEVREAVRPGGHGRCAGRRGRWDGGLHHLRVLVHQGLGRSRAGTLLRTPDSEGAPPGTGTGDGPEDLLVVGPLLAVVVVGQPFLPEDRLRLGHRVGPGLGRRPVETGPHGCDEPTCRGVRAGQAEHSEDLEGDALAHGRGGFCASPVPIRGRQPSVAHLPRASSAARRRRAWSTACTPDFCGWAHRA